MKTKVNIKDFKSIKLIDNLTLYSDKINYLVGENNSGKSNILDSIISLKETIPNSRPKVNYEIDGISDDNLETEVSIEIGYTKEEKESINNIIEKLGLTPSSFENDFKFCFNSNSSWSELWKKLSELIGSQSYWESYLKYKSSENLMQLLLNDNDFTKDISSTSASIKDNSELKEKLGLLQEFKNITSKELLIFHSRNNYDIKDSYNLRSLSMNSTDPSFDPTVRPFIDFLIKGTNITIDNINNWLKTTDTSAQISLTKKFDTEANKRLKEIFNKYFGDELNSVINLKAIKPNFSIDIAPKKKFHYLASEKNLVSDGMKSIIKSLFSFEKMKVNFEANKNLVFLFLVDEPEKNINPLIQEKYIEAINENINNLFKDYNCYVVVTTHSLSIIPSIDINNVPSHFNFIEREPELETHIVKDDINRISKANKFLIEKSCIVSKKQK